MIVYNTKEWLSFIFSFHKADTFRKMWFTLIVVAVFSFIIAYIEIDYLELGKSSNLKNISILHQALLATDNVKHTKKIDKPHIGCASSS